MYTPVCYRMYMSVGSLMPHAADRTYLLVCIFRHVGIFR